MKPAEVPSATAGEGSELMPPRPSSSTQVSFVPPPCDELTTREPSFKATRVRPNASGQTRRANAPDETLQVFETT